LPPMHLDDYLLTGSPSIQRIYYSRSLQVFV
jgi:hypothetical protein